MTSSLSQDLSIPSNQRTAHVRDALERYRAHLVEGRGTSIHTLLPLIFKLKGKPFSIEHGHFLHEPCYRLIGAVPRRMIYKAGRQVAKCVSRNTLVRKSHGVLVQAKDLVLGDKVVTCTPSMRASTGVVSNIWHNGVQKVFEIETRLGAKFRVTGNHRLRTLYGYTEVKDLQVGSRLGSLRRGGVFGTKTVDRNRLILTAYMLGDGSTSGFVTFSGVRGPVTDEFTELLSQVGNLDWHGPCADKPHLEVVISRREGALWRWLKEDGLWAVKSPSRFLPSWVFQLSKADTCLFLSRLWATDGTIRPRPNGQDISYTSTSRRLAGDVQSLLAKLGILASTTTKAASYNGVRHHDAHLVRVEGREAWARFHELLQVPGKPAIAIRDTEERSNRDTVPLEINLQLNAASDRLGRKHDRSFQSAGLRRTAKYPLSRPKLAAYRDHLAKHMPDDEVTKQLSDLIDGDLVWDEVTSILPYGEEEVLDIEVVGDHNFVIDTGVVSHNSSNFAASGVLRGATHPYFNHLTVTPLFEQVRKFSSNYVRPFLTESSFKTQLIRPGSDNSVLQRTLANGSNLFYNYASNSADRIRGTSTDGTDLDEFQDFDLTVVPIIESCMDASPFKFVRYGGTPKTMDGPLQLYWEKSSQAHWYIPCQETGCKHNNRCAVDGDLLAMVDNPITLVCAKCAKPVDSRLGFYIHDRPELREIFPGYHMPQPCFPMHYADKAAWHKLQDVRLNKPKYMFYNEVLGESIDVGLKMMTREELARAARIPTRQPSDHMPGKYIISAVGVDWGGKGKELTTDKEEFISNTAIAVAGMRGDGVVEVTNIRRTPYEADHNAEAEMVRNTLAECRANRLAHDFGGAGDVRETVLIHAGVPKKIIMPCTYAIMAVNKPIVHYQPSGATGARLSYTVDKSRSLQLLCMLIKTGQVLLPDWETNKEALSDFFALYEESIEGPRSSARKLVRKMPRRTDDVCHAINFAVMCCYHSTKRWPNLAEAYQKLAGDPETWTENDAT